MSKLVHLLGYATAFIVVGLLVMTATGTLPSALRGDLMGGFIMPSPDAAPLANDPSMMGMMPAPADATLPGSDSMTTGEYMDAFDAASTENGPMVPSLLDPTQMVPSDWNDLSQTSAEITYDGPDTSVSPDISALGYMGGDTGGDGGSSGGAAAPVCSAAVSAYNKAASTLTITLNVVRKEPNSKFEYQALLLIRKDLVGACYDGKDVGCAGGCQKVANSPSKANFLYGKCTVSSLVSVKTGGRITGRKATVSCTPSSCSVTQACEGMPVTQCCYSNGVNYACKAVCAPGESSVSYPRAADCAALCKAGIPALAVDDTNRACCKNAAGQFSCKKVCDAGDSLVFASTTKNACSEACHEDTAHSLAPSATPQASVCCWKPRQTSYPYVCKVTCDPGEEGLQFGTPSDCSKFCTPNPTPMSTYPQYFQ